MFVVAPVPVWAEVTPIDGAMERYRRLTSIAPKPCQAENGSSDIVVCANRKLRDSQKVPYIEELRVGDRPRLVSGEVAGQNLGPSCPPRGCPCPRSKCGIGYILRKLSGG
jgi:hypothetical protein